VLSHLLQRLLIAGPTALGVATLVFLLIHVIPGDPVDAMLGESASQASRAELRAHLGLDRPLTEQYFGFLADLAHGDLGTSIHSQEPVAALVAEHLPMTALLAATALLIAVGIAIPLGLIAAARAGGAADRCCLALSLIGVSIPNFWLGPMLVLAFSIALGALPVAGSESPWHLVLPAVTLGASLAGVLTRMTRSSVVEVLRQDYIRTARATGASEARTLSRHALANALTPLISVIGLQAGSLLAGSVITETIFSWPGIGRLTIDAIRSRDYPLVQGCVLVIAISYIAINFLTDVAYAWADPRVRIRADDDAR
jgi:peptide/nickel transport system permease protein